MASNQVWVVRDPSGAIVGAGAERLLVLRVKDVNAVRVLSTESVFVGNHVFRALLDMMEKMPSGYSDHDDNRARFANALVGYLQANAPVGYLQAEVREQGAGPGEGRGDE